MRRMLIVKAGVPVLLALVCAGLVLCGQRGAGLAVGLCIPPLSLILRQG